MPKAFPVPIRGSNGQSLLHIEIQIQIRSDEPLQLPWNWLAGTLQYAPAAGLRHYLDTNLPELLGGFADIGLRWGRFQHFQEGDCVCMDISLFRPAQADQFQFIMSRNLEGCNDTWLGVEEVYHSFDMSYHGCPSNAIHVKPKHMQKVAVTGEWCQMLPDASKPLWKAHHGIDMGGQTVGDDIAADLHDSHYWIQLMFDACEECWSLMDVHVVPLNNDFKPFTCEVAGQSDWHLKKQQVKQLFPCYRESSRGSKQQGKTVK